MIVVQLTGGLGNQMFQYAFGKYISVQNNTTLVLDTSYLQSKLPFKKWATPMQYELYIFNIKATIASNIISSNFLLYPFAKAEYLIRTKLNESKYQVMLENEFRYNAVFLETKDNSYIQGNFQSEKYFNQIENEIRNDFTFKNILNAINTKWKTQIENCNAVSVHIRRGDYISINRNAQKFIAIPLEYYQNAIKIISDRVACPEFFIFSDDIAWVKKNLRTDVPVHFINNNSTAETANIDMQLMSLCKHNIIANSTFSWWAAWLNKHPEKIVIAPENWFVDKSLNSSDIIPSSWIKL